MISQFLIDACPLPAVDGEERCFVRLRRAARSTAVAIVLDLSESCELAQDVFARMPRLFRNVPLTSKLWVYRLGRETPLNDPDLDRIEHLVDASLKLDRWMHDRFEMEYAQCSGSLLRTPLMDITQRVAQLQITDTLVIVLTDGELLDRGRALIPDAWKLIGVQVEPRFRATKNWERVVGSNVLYHWSDPRLTPDVFGSFRQVPPSATVSFEETAWAEVMLSSTDTTVIAPGRRSYSWLGENPHFDIVISSRKPLPLDAEIVVGVMGINSDSRLSVRSAQAMSIDAVPGAFISRSVKGESDFYHLLLDSTTLKDDEAGQIDWQLYFTRAVGERRRWTDDELSRSDGLFLGKILSEAASRFDTAVAFVQNAEGVSTNRCLVFGLSRRDKPALRINLDADTPFGISSQQIEIRHDRFEGRWIFSIDDKQFELHPNIGDRIDHSIAFDGKQWTAFHSGPLN